jgi:hypothetical protein
MSPRRMWVAAIVFDLVGTGMLIAGVLWEPMLLLVGAPFGLLGALLLGLLVYGARFRHSQPERYARWLWWVNLIGGIAGAALYAVPSLLVLPAMLLLGLHEQLWLGALFSVTGLLVGVATALLAAHLIRGRPRPENRPDELHWDTDAYRRWVQTGDEATDEGQERNGT